MFFVVIFEIGSLLCGVATSSTFFIVGRAVAGLGVSGLENGALTLIAGAVPMQKRPCKSQMTQLQRLSRCPDDARLSRLEANPWNFTCRVHRSSICR